MALPSTNIGMGDINIEINRSRTSQISLWDAERGVYATINTNSSSRPNGSKPATMDEWRGYNHDASPPLSISPTSVRLSSNFSSFTLTITTTGSWSYSDNQSWINTNTTSGFGNSSITITVQNNFGSTTRFGTVSISSGGITRSCSVTQDPPSGNFR